MNGLLLNPFLMSWTGNFILILIHVLPIRTISVRDISPRKMTDFHKIGGCRVFCNPPYGRDIAKWVEKSFREGCKDNTLVVMLLPARTDTRYFHDFILHRSEIRFVSGRLKFGQQKNSAPFPSIVVIFRGAYV